MKTAFVLLLIFNSGSNLVLCQSDDEAQGLNQKLLVVSFDGFRQSYFEDGNRFLPWFSHFRNQGVYSDTVQSIFPSETFPNHFAIVTGLYAESHGIVANNMYDPRMNLTFTKSDNTPFWWAAEPIWVTAVRQGRRVSVSFWPGSAVKYPPYDYTPTFYRPVYNASVPMEERIDETVEYLKNSGVNLAFLYYNQPDTDGHHFGAQSTNVHDRLQLVDWYLSYLLKRLDESDLGKDRLNIILCSDHGMTNLTNPLYLEDIVPKEDIERVPAFGPVVHIQPKQGKLESLLARLNEASDSGLPFTAYRKWDLPPEFHYSHNDRIMDIVVVCQLGTYMKFTRPPSKVTGVHGYDPRLVPMKPMFMARGPAFKKGAYRAKNVFETKDIYAIIAHVSGVKPLATNASLELVKDLFASSHAIINSAPNLQRIIITAASLAVFTLAIKF